MLLQVDCYGSAVQGIQRMELILVFLVAALFSTPAFNSLLWMQKLFNVVCLHF